MYIKKIRNIFFKFLLITFISLFLFLIIDFFFGRFLIKKYSSIIKENLFYQKKYRVYDPIFHHSFAPSIGDTITQWGAKLRHNICTNEYGFISQCGAKKEEFYDIIFIGDSFTEGVGYKYEDTFVGLIQNKLKLPTANMAVKSYSTKIYLSKTKYFLDKGVTFKHLVVFIDISDLIDDSNDYILTKNFIIKDKKLGKRIETFINVNFQLLDYFVFYLKNENIIKNFNFVKSIKKYLSKNKEIVLNNSGNVISDNKAQEWQLRSDLRSQWTYSKTNQIKGYDLPIDVAINEQVKTMTQLYELLKKNNIKLSIAVYPWPQTILYDKRENLMKTTWENFCINKCANFINTFPLFMNGGDQISKRKIIDKYYIENDFHFNLEGNKLIADYFIKNFKF
jgi:lysophospholipase L1-like esterase